MKNEALAIYSALSAIVFYVYLYSYIFEAGYFNSINPLKLFEKINLKINKIMTSFLRKFGEIFPYWNLFIGMNPEKFFDIVVEVDTLEKGIIRWVGTKDLCFGNLKLKNKYFILSLISHYSTNQRCTNKLIVEQVLSFAKEKNLTVNEITINLIPFLIKEDSYEEVSGEKKQTPNQNLKIKHFVWQNRKSPKYKTFGKSNYELF